MAGRGPAPKGERSRGRGTPSELTVGGKLFGRPLPKGVLPDGESWHPMTMRWWMALRRFPLLEHEPEIGWQFLLDTALMHHTMWTKGRWEFAAEIRLRVAKYGATPEDRMRLKIAIATPSDSRPQQGDADPAGTVTDIGSRRSRLLSG